MFVLILISLNLRPKDPAWPRWSPDAGLESDSQSNSFRDVAFFGMTLYQIEPSLCIRLRARAGVSNFLPVTTFNPQLGHNLTLGIRKY